jgi:hypothetical protein
MHGSFRIVFDKDFIGCKVKTLYKFRDNSLHGEWGGRGDTRYEIVFRVEYIIGRGVKVVLDSEDWTWEQGGIALFLLLDLLHCNFHIVLNYFS